MSKLTVANLFHSVRALNVSHGISPRSAHLIGENLWRLTSDADSVHPRLSLAQLLGAARFVFEDGGDHLLPGDDYAGGRPQQSERQLRFDAEHRLAFDPRCERQVPEPARQALRKGLGAAQAREQLGQDHWIVIVVDAQAPSAELPFELLQAFRALRRVLVLWCDEQASHRESPQPQASAATAFEQLSADPSLLCLGPIGGLDTEGLIAVLEAVKALERPAVLHLRLRAEPSPFELSESDEQHHLPAENLRAPRRLRADGPAHLAAAPPSALTVAIERVSRCAAANRRVSSVALLSAGNSLANAALLSQHRIRRLEPNADAAVWCAGLADAGCRPLILLDETTLQRLWWPLVELISDPQRQATLVLTPPTDERSVLPLAVRGIDQLRLIPHLPLLVPRDATELERMLAATAALPGPAAICLPAGVAEAPSVGVCEEAEFARAALLRPGKDAALFAVGDGVSVAASAAELLERQGIEAAVVDLRYIHPLDESAVLAALGAAPLAMLVTEEIGAQGLDSAVSELLRQRGRTNCIIASKPSQLHDSGDPHERRIRRSRDIADHCLKALRSRTAGKAAANTAAIFGPAASRAGAEDEQRQIEAIQLSPTMAAWIDEYSKLGQRGLYLWKWCRHGLALTTLPCVPAELQDDVCDTKLLSILLCVLLDDVADQHGKRQLLEILVDPAGPRSEQQLAGLSEHECDYAKFTWRVWEDYFARVRRYPRYDDFAELLHFDLLQLSNTLRYSHLLNDRLCFLNLAEHDLYSPHNIMMVNFATLDLMCSPDFPMSEVGRLREAVWHAQCMGRIGNLLATWRREIADRDFTSGVFARAVMEGDLTVDQLMAAGREQIEDVIRQGGHEEHFLRRWHEHREHFCGRLDQIPVRGMRRLVEGHDRMFRMHVGSEGLI